MNCNIVAIIVTYFPNQDNLERLIRSIIIQVDKVILIDNGSDKATLLWLEQLIKNYQIEFILKTKNDGLSVAQNLGIKKAKQHNPNFVILFDHDSEPESNMVATLISAFYKKQNEGIAIGAMAPLYKDKESNKKTAFLRIKGGKFKKVYGEAGQILEVDLVIASGMLIPMTTINHVGDMDKGLFIDLVDTEWCIRAKSMGFHIFGVVDASMTHQLGNQKIRIWLGKWMSVTCHAPFRYYFMVRNSILLVKRRYVPFGYKLALFVHCLQIVAFFSIFSPRRMECLKMFSRGFFDGMIDSSSLSPLPIK